MSNENQDHQVLCQWTGEHCSISETVEIESGLYVRLEHKQDYINEYFITCSYDQCAYPESVMVVADDGEYVHQDNLDEYESESRSWDDERFNKTIYGLI